MWVPITPHESGGSGSGSTWFPGSEDESVRGDGSADCDGDSDGDEPATSRCGSRKGGVDPLLYCVVGAAPPVRPYFSTTAATFLASSSASTLVAASA